MAAAVVFNLDHNAVGVGRSKDAIEKSSDGRGRFSFPFLCNIATQTQTRCPSLFTLQVYSACRLWRNPLIQRMIEHAESNCRYVVHLLAGMAQCNVLAERRPSCQPAGTEQKTITRSPLAKGKSSLSPLFSFLMSHLPWLTDSGQVSVFLHAASLSI